MLYDERRYLTEEWKKFRQIIVNTYKGKCCDCEAKGWHVHHNSYKNWGKSNLAEAMDCELLCDSCHKKRHNLKEE